MIVLILLYDYDQMSSNASKDVQNPPEQGYLAITHVSLICILGLGFGFQISIRTRIRLTFQVRFSDTTQDSCHYG